MRIEIKTRTPIKDKDIKALYIIQEAMKVSSERMRKANLDFVLGKYGLQVINTPIKSTAHE